MKKSIKFVPVQLTFFLIIGILTATFFEIQPKTVFVLLGVLIAAFTISYIYVNKQYKTSVVFSLVMFLITLCIGISSVTLKNQRNYKSHYSNGYFKVDSTYNTIVTIQKILKSNNYYHKYEVEVNNLNSNTVSGSLLLNIQKDSLSEMLKVDDVIFLKAKFKSIPLPRNPFGFNYKNYLKNRQIYHQVYCYNKCFEKLKPTNKSINGLTASFREKITTDLKRDGYKNNELGVVSALLLGQRHIVTSDLLDSYSKAGAIHILAVSGLHIGIIMLILSFLLKPLEYIKHGKTAISISIIILLWMYAFIAGLSPSVVRAVTMFTAVTVGMYLNRPSNIYNTLIISMFVLLLFNPLYLFEVGFQLSYVAVFSIVWLQPKLTSLWSPKYKLINYFWQLFTVSVAAQIGVAPLSIYYFHQFPGLFFVSNILIIPILGVILIIGFIVVFLSLLNNLPLLLSEGYIFCIKTLNNLVNWIAMQESFIVENISISIFKLLLIYSSIIFFFKLIENRTYHRLVFFLSSLVLINFLLLFEKFKLQSQDEIVVFHKNRSSLIGVRKGDELSIYSSDKTTGNNRILKDYLIGNGLNKYTLKFKKDYLLFSKNKVLLIVDSIGCYQFTSIKPSIIVLQNSPKINLERLIDFHKPELIVTDASNYKNYIKIWEQTCLKMRTPFYNTLEKGAFILKK